MLRQHALAERIDLAEGYRLEATRSLKAEAESANAAEQVEHAKFGQTAILHTTKAKIASVTTASPTWDRMDAG